MDYASAIKLLASYGQDHVLHYYDKLSQNKKEELLSYVDKIDFTALNGICKEDKKVGELTPCDALSLKQVKKGRRTYEETGLSAIRAGKVAVLLLAGGQGTRLGWDGPKGTYDLGVSRELTVFECQFNSLKALCKKAGVSVHVFIMTSGSNDQATREFLEEKNYFGYDASYVHFFVQCDAPSLSFDKKILMEEKYKPALASNGNGGWFSSLEKSPAGKLIRKYDIEWINVCGVDNVLQKLGDPVFIGAAISGGYSCASKVVKKVSPDEKVGVLCKEDGEPSVIEYYEMPQKLKMRHDINGELTFCYGVILNYLFRVEKLKATARKKLPYHLAEKKINCIKGGKKFIPEEPNGYKPELLVVDQVRLMGDCLGFEVEREKEFAPVKNAEGVDSPETARKLLEMNGVTL